MSSHNSSTGKLVSNPEKPLGLPDKINDFIAKLKKHGTCDDISCVVHEVNVTVFHVLHTKCAKTEISACKPMKVCSVFIKVCSCVEF